MLDQIVAHVRAGLPALRARAGSVMEAAAAAPPARDFEAALSRPGLSVIAEIKRASPSRGLLNAGLDPAAQARRYEAGGAAAISVLTEPKYFHGTAADLRAAKAAVRVPILRKDFTIDPLQIWEARAMGADAVLLIVAVLSPDDVHDLLGVAQAAGLTAVVEAHSIEEAETAVASGARVVGVNNRDLTSFEVSLETAEKVAPLLSDVPVAVAESGIFTADDAARMRAAGYDAVLVGESLVRSGDPASAIEMLRQAGRP